MDKRVRLSAPGLMAMASTSNRGQLTFDRWSCVATATFMNMHRILERAGLRPTLPRVLVLEFFHHHPHEHFSAEQVYKRLNGDTRNMSLGTLYRALGLLVEGDLLSSVAFGIGADRSQTPTVRRMWDTGSCWPFPHAVNLFRFAYESELLLRRKSAGLLTLRLRTHV
jgi:Ferric uptake regulator family